MTTRSKSSKSQKKPSTDPQPPPPTQPTPSNTSIRPTPRKKNAPAPPTPEEALLGEFHFLYDELVKIKGALAIGDTQVRKTLCPNFDAALVSAPINL